jgi:phosphoribosylformylglycinamidine cyclo-ligase
MIINDLITVGADPINLQAYCAVGDSSWFRDEQRSIDLANGFRVAADLSGANWGGGETPSLSGIIYPTAIDLGGSAYGIIDPKSRIAIADEKSGVQSKLKEGDAIVVVESSGIHANGLSLARRIASHIAEQKGLGLPDAYATELDDGTMFGESLLTPTHIYAGLTRDIFDAGIDIHYMVNVTGHGWRKFMRSPEDLSYVIDRVPDPQSIFPFIQEHSQSSEKDMYGNFNMGAGFVYFVPEHQVSMIREIALSHHNLKADGVGYVEKGPKRVVIRPKNIEFQGSSLAVR